MTYYSVITVTPTTDTWIPAYLPAVKVLMDKHGGKYLARTASHERLEGESADVGLRIVIEWPSKAAAEAFMSDPEYASHLGARTAGSDSHHFLIEGKDDFS